MSTQQEVFEEVIESVLASWTALELAVSHFDGHFREGQHRRIVLLEALSDSIRQEQYTEVDIAEFINEYMFEQFSMELDDESHYQVAQVLLSAWSLIKQSQRPHISKRPSGAACSVIKDETVEVSGDEIDEDMDMDESPSQTQHQPRIITDEDGWSTIVPRK